MNRDRLERMIKVKSLFKEEAQARTNKTKEELERERQKLQAMKEQMQNLIIEIKSPENNVVKADRLDLMYGVLHRLREGMKDQTEVIDGKKKEYEKNKRQLIEAHKEEKALETLLERSLRKRWQEELKKEQKESDFNNLIKKFRG